MRIVSIDEGGDVFAVFLPAAGLGVGDEVEVLRRAPFGGPLHLRLRCGTEFAVGRDVASMISVQCLSHVHALCERCDNC